MLVLDGADVGVFDIGRSAGNGLQRRKASMLVVDIVEKEAGSEDVARGQVSLDFGEIAGAPVVVSVSIGRKLGD